MKAFPALLVFAATASALNVAGRPHRRGGQQVTATEPTTEVALPGPTAEELPEILGADLLPTNKAQANKPVTQVLHSDEGMAYYGVLHVGGQPQQSIYDTGSFDIVVVSKCTDKEEARLRELDASKPVFTPFANPFEAASFEPLGQIGEIESMVGDLEDLDLPQEIKDILNDSPFGGSDPFGSMWPFGLHRVNSTRVKRREDEDTCCRQSKCPHSGYQSLASGVNFKDTQNATEKITYGSGTCIVKPVVDHVELKDNFYVGKKDAVIGGGDIPVKVVVDHEVELFKETSLQAIVGIGPGPFQNRSARMVSHLGIERFTFCLSEDARKDGKIIWNDKSREKDPDWMTVPSTAKMFWGAHSSEWTLTSNWGPWGVFQHEGKVGCQDGCGAVIDTGTSLITPPKEVIDAIMMEVESGGVEDCSDVSKFPTLHFKLNGQEFSLPPQSYIADAGSMGMDDAVDMHQKLGLAIPLLPMNLTAERSAMRLARQRGDTASSNKCVLLLGDGSDMGNTQYGPMAIIGMPLFRKYAVQFDLSQDFAGNEATDEVPTRMMHFTEASPDCQGSMTGNRFRQAIGQKLQKVNLEKLRTSRLSNKVKAFTKALDAVKHAAEKQDFEWMNLKTFTI